MQTITKSTRCGGCFFFRPLRGEVFVFLVKTQNIEESWRTRISLPIPDLMTAKIYDANSDSSLQRYWADIEAYPVLSVEEETALAKKIREGNQVALEKLVNANLRYVVKVANKFKQDEEGLMGLISEGNQGLLEAALRFDVSSGNRFLTYATYWIQKYILEALAQKHEAVHIPKYQAESLQRVKKASAVFMQKHERTPRPHELADELNMEIDDVLFLLGLAQQTKAFNAPIKLGDEEDEHTFMDEYQDNEAEKTDHKLEDESLKTDLSDAFTLLTDREKKVLICLYGIGREKLTQKEISKELNISPPRVWQIKERALHKLKVAGHDGDLKTYLEK